MFRSLFGKRKKRDAPAEDSATADESIRSAGVGDVVVVSGYSHTLGDAYFLVESTARYESRAGERSYELMGVDGDRRVAIEWHDYDGLFISIRDLGPPMGLSAIGLTEEQLGHMDESHSVDNAIEFEGNTYRYRNSDEMTYYRGQGEPDRFWGWEFFDDQSGRVMSVVKGDGSPFEVYVSSSVPPDIVSVYKK